MSEPMTNREIEDVLTSIRRLVAQEGGRVENGRLILTEAQRVNALSQAAVARTQANTAAAPTIVTEALAASVDLSIPAPDFGKLEATIAELEAAVSARGGTFEAEGFENEAAEGAPRASNVTELYGRLSFSHRGTEAANDAPAAVVEPVAEPVSAPLSEPASAPASQAEAAEPEVAPESLPESLPAEAGLADPEPAPVAAAEPPAEPEPDAAEEDYPEETILDEEALHALISQIVRDELRGQLGERITQQVRKLVRAEIARALEDRDLL